MTKETDVINTLPEAWQKLIKDTPRESKDLFVDIIAQSLLDEAIKTGKSPATIGKRLLKDRGEKQMNYESYREKQRKLNVLYRKAYRHKWAKNYFLAKKKELREKYPLHSSRQTMETLFPNRRSK